MRFDVDRIAKALAGAMQRQRVDTHSLARRCGSKAVYQAVERREFFYHVPMRLAHRVHRIAARQLQRLTFDHQRKLRQIMRILLAREPLLG
ncbi:hypothetical protein [Burkholderia sp. WSM2230]|uniref:hypothetical protein n=1 Tax=Burkholderia sp. WSM2230 TaxID=944435 RepID=UPI001E3164A2|nr:hypothetical protein [Burkholderia sp. WSM2230]